MSLNWSVEAVQDYETVCKITVDHDDPSGRYVAGDKLWNPVTEALVWSCVAVGLRGITESNAGEFFARVRLVEQTEGPMLVRAVDPETGERPSGAKAFITEAEVLAHVGLSTNVTNETRSQFMKRISQRVDSLVAHFDRTAEKAARVAA
jgi:hypothetical protein